MISTAVSWLIMSRRLLIVSCPGRFHDYRSVVIRQSTRISRSLVIGNWLRM